MTDSEISRRLALAIGWEERYVYESANAVRINKHGDWRRFDYRDTAVIWPIAEKFDCFPYRLHASEKWYAVCPFGVAGSFANTAAKAVALAVIAAKGKA